MTYIQDYFSKKVGSNLNAYKLWLIHSAVYCAALKTNEASTYRYLFIRNNKQNFIH